MFSALNVNKIYLATNILMLNTVVAFTLQLEARYLVREFGCLSNYVLSLKGDVI